MRGYLLTAAVAAVVGLGATSNLAAARPGATTIVHKPTASITFSPTAVVKGKYFKKRETVTVYLSSTTTGGSWHKKVRATATGTFTVSFGTSTGLNSCDQYTLKVVGLLRSRFTTSHDLVPC